MEAIPRWVQIVFLGTGAVSFVISCLIVLGGAGRAARRPGDPQHVHDGGVPRTGGFALAVGAMFGVALASIRFGAPAQFLWILLGVSVPIFGMGMAEDVFGRVTPRWRYYASLGSGGLAFVLAGVQLTRVDVAIVDSWLLSTSFSFAATVFCVAGVSQAYNIVDGKNGLAGGCGAIALICIGVLAVKYRDWPMAAFAVSCAAAIVGFWLLNFPKGLLFLGDGGAYLLGFFVAINSVMLVQRHDAVSAWFPVLLSAYPIVETLASVFRRIFVERTKFHQPDHRHLHSLMYQYISRNAVFTRAPEWLLNSMTATPFLFAAVIVAVLAYNLREMVLELQVLFLALVVLYACCYTILRVKTERHRTA